MKLKYFLAVFVLCLFGILPAAAQNQTNNKSTDATALDNDEDLRRAVESSAGSQTEFIKNLESYLQKYPQSARRGEIERELYKMALELRDRNRSISYAERLITSNGHDVDV